MAGLPADIREALVELKAGLAHAFGPRLQRVVLFGSYARGVVHEDSDVDVLVVLSPRVGSSFLP